MNDTEWFKVPGSDIRITMLRAGIDAVHRDGFLLHAAEATIGLGHAPVLFNSVLHAPDHMHVHGHAGSNQACIMTLPTMRFSCLTHLTKFPKPHLHKACAGWWAGALLDW